MIIKSVYCSNGEPLATSKAQRYITNERKISPGGIFSYGCGVRNWSSINTAVKIVYNKTDRGRYYHYMIGFDPADKVDEKKALKIGKNIAKYWGDRYVVGAVHNNTGHIHIHILVSYTTIDGKQKGMGGNDLSDLKCFISHIAEAEGCCKVRMYNNTVQKHTGSISDCDTDDPEFEIPDTEYLADPQELFGDITCDMAGEMRNEPSDRQVVNKCYITNNNYNFWAPTTFYAAGRYGYGYNNRANQQYPALTGSAGNAAALNNAPASVPLPPAVPSVPVLPEAKSLVNPFVVDKTQDIIMYLVVIEGDNVMLPNAQKCYFNDYAQALQFAKQCSAIGFRAYVYESINGILNPFSLKFI